MRGRPGWTGPITHLRVDVLDDESPAPQGSRVTFEEWLIKGDR
jgi:hypothetical protein